MTGKPTESEGSTGEFSVDEEDQLQPEDTLADRGTDDVLDEGISPVERPLALDEYGTTPREQAEGEDLGARLDREVPDVTAPTEPVDEGAIAGDRRTGRLTADGPQGDLTARDVGIDGAGASAEEAAVHDTTVPDDR